MFKGVGDGRLTGELEAPGGAEGGDGGLSEGYQATQGNVTEVDVEVRESGPGEGGGRGWGKALEDTLGCCDANPVESKGTGGGQQGLEVGEPGRGGGGVEGIGCGGGEMDQSAAHETCVGGGGGARREWEEEPCGPGEEVVCLPGEDGLHVSGTSGDDGEGPPLGCPEDRPWRGADLKPAWWEGLREVQGAEDDQATVVCQRGTVQGWVGWRHQSEGKFDHNRSSGVGGSDEDGGGRCVGLVRTGTSSKGRVRGGREGEEEAVTCSRAVPRRRHGRSGGSRQGRHWGGKGRGKGGRWLREQVRVEQPGAQRGIPPMTDPTHRGLWAQEHTPRVVPRKRVGSGALRKCPLGVLLAWAQSPSRGPVDATWIPSRGRPACAREETNAKGKGSGAAVEAAGGANLAASLSCCMGQKGRKNPKREAAEEAQCCERALIRHERW